MTLDTCKQKLNTTIAKNPSLKGSFSELTQLARGGEKGACITEFGGLSAIQKYVTSPSNIT